ncbi:DMT family transporter [Aspergillus affinis]|uniref:DMT family transporter n=1 Tax=Aspergillus affinis TaxID=1070780 RepID=UPI0022FEE30C|nr:DUF6 domain protein [Aspergillus affinis]KAI9039489.1 DUF6 domain protein [Aspergillus affinis]
MSTSPSDPGRVSHPTAHAESSSSRLSFKWMGFSRRSNLPDVNEADVRQPLLGSQPPPSSSSWWEDTRESAGEVWAQGKGMILVMMSQFFGSSMNTMTKLLENQGRNGEGLSPFQILFARMSITVLASYLYMWYAKVPHPFGTRSELGLLLLRAAGGFWGVYGLYYSVQYLPLSEATVLTFLAPILSCYACSLYMPNETFTRKQQLAALVSLVGVVLIARPFSHATSDRDSVDKMHRSLAIAMALVGVLGASCAYSAIRMIGQRCHPLVSVTYFSTFTTVVSFLAMLVIPSVPLELPGTVTEWTLLAGLGVCGFLLQFLLTAGLSYVPPAPRRSTTKGNRRATTSQYGSNDDDGDENDTDESRKPSSSGSRATSMLYTQMLFALFYDGVVWNNTLSAVSWLGSGLILTSAIYVAMARETRSDGGAAAVASKETDEPNEGRSDTVNDDLERRHGETWRNAGEQRCMRKGGWGRQNEVGGRTI